MKRIILSSIFSFVALTGCVSLSGETPAVYDKPIVKSFSATPAAIDEAASSTLKWNVAGATNVFIDQGVGNVAITGSTSVAPQATTTYTLTAANAFGTTTARTQVTVKGPAPARPPVSGNNPVINYFTANPTIVNAGKPVTLSWSIFNATDIRIIPEISPAEAEVAVTIFPAATTTYVLTASNSTGTVTRQVTVVVSSGQPSPGIGRREAVLNLIAGESGSLVKSGTAYNKYLYVCAGDNSANLPSRAFLSFDISSIPVNATISEAILDFGAYSVTGNPTYGGSVHGNMGAMEVYRAQYQRFEDLGRLAYDFPAAQAGTVRWDGVSNTPLLLDVTLDKNGVNIIQSLLAENSVRCQFRVQFFTTTNWDSVADSICFDRAMLKVVYTAP